MTPRIALVDVGAGNRFNVETALQGLGAQIERVADAEALSALDPAAIVVPGVANFGFVATALKRTGLDVALRAAIARGTPYLGICAGMQILYERSEEAPDAPGLGVLAGTVRRVPGPRAPHMGWNEVRWLQPGVAENGWAYFANAYALPPQSAGIAAVATFGAPFAAACKLDRMTGYQFHPERSGAYGISLLAGWLEEWSLAYAR